MESINNFDILICGESTDDMHEFKIILDNLSAKICKVKELIIPYNGEPENARQMTRAGAEAMGLEPCKKCY